MAEQTEKAFLKQPKVFLSSKKSSKGKKFGKGSNRFWKSIGLGFKTPREAIEGLYLGWNLPQCQDDEDHYCPEELPALYQEIPKAIVKNCEIQCVESHSCWIFWWREEGLHRDVRGRILAGTCHSVKMMRTIIVWRNCLHYIKKFQRYEKRHSNIAANISPCFRVKEGNHVIIGQCRPLSKTVRFNMLKVIPAGSSGGGKKAFTGM